MESMEADEMETFQRLSDQYQAEIPGPLLGQKLPISSLITEYAQADATYQTKTAALSAQYGYYRPVKGDGQCGWRAAVFGYFEQLLKYSDPQKLMREHDRLRSLSDELPALGFDFSMIEMFMEYSLELLQKLREALERGENGESILLETLNDPSESDSVVFFFKLLTSAYMQFHADQYQGFLETTIEDYRQSRIEAHAQEIEQIGLQALTDGIVAPAGVALEVLYLDRSQGDEVTPHMFVQDAQDRPTIRLLYRPGHYDMIYKGAQPIQVQRALPDLAAVRAHSPHSSFSNLDSLPTVVNHQGFDGQQSEWTSIARNPFTKDAAGSDFGSMHHQTYNIYDGIAYPSSEHSPAILARRKREHVTRKQSLEPATPSSPSSPMAHTDCQSPDNFIRLSPFTFDYHREGREALPPETGQFRNSPFHPAHFQNENFQPLMWNANNKQ